MKTETTKKIEDEAKKRYPDANPNDSYIEDKASTLNRNRKAAFIRGAEFMDSLSESKQMKWEEYIKQFEKLNEIWNGIPEPLRTLLRQQIDFFAPQPNQQGCEEFAKEYGWVKWEPDGKTFWWKDGELINSEELNKRYTSPSPQKTQTK